MLLIPFTLVFVSISLYTWIHEHLMLEWSLTNQALKGIRKNFIKCFKLIFLDRIILEKRVTNCIEWIM